MSGGLFVVIFVSLVCRLLNILVRPKDRIVLFGNIWAACHEFRLVGCVIAARFNEYTFCPFCLKVCSILLEILVCCRNIQIANEIFWNLCLLILLIFAKAADLNRVVIFDFGNRRDYPSALDSVGAEAYFFPVRESFCKLFCCIVSQIVSACKCLFYCARLGYTRV